MRVKDKAQGHLHIALFCSILVHDPQIAYFYFLPLVVNYSRKGAAINDPTLYTNKIRNVCCYSDNRVNITISQKQEEERLH